MKPAQCTWTISKSIFPCTASSFRRSNLAIIMCCSAFAAKGVAHCVKVVRSQVLSHQARTTTSGSDEATISWC
jgi:hypothetical protein